MIQSFSRLNVADNSGAKSVMCIKVLGSKKQAQAQIGDVLVVTIKDALPRGVVKKKEVARAVIVRQRAPFQRKDGSVISFDDNAVVIIDSENQPRGTRVIGPVAREIRTRGFQKIISQAPEVL
jgi:large subunit ribosomal protein L14